MRFKRIEFLLSSIGKEMKERSAKARRLKVLLKANGLKGKGDEVSLVLFSVL